MTKDVYSYTKFQAIMATFSSHEICSLDSFPFPNCPKLSSSFNAVIVVLYVDHLYPPINCVTTQISGTPEAVHLRSLAPHLTRLAATTLYIATYPDYLV